MRRKKIDNLLGRTQEERRALGILSGHAELVAELSRAAARMLARDEAFHATEREWPIRYMARIVLPPVGGVTELRYDYDSRGADEIMGGHGSLTTLDPFHDNRWCEIGDRRVFQRLTEISHPGLPWSIKLRTKMDHAVRYRRRADNHRAIDAERRARGLHEQFLVYGREWVAAAKLDDVSLVQDDAAEHDLAVSLTNFHQPTVINDEGAQRFLRYLPQREIEE